MNQEEAEAETKPQAEQQGKVHYMRRLITAAPFWRQAFEFFLANLSSHDARIGNAGQTRRALRRRFNAASERNTRRFARLLS